MKSCILFYRNDADMHLKHDISATNGKDFVMLPSISCLITQSFFHTLNLIINILNNW